MSSTTYTLYFIRASASITGLTSKQEFLSFEAALDFANAHAVQWIIRRNNTVLARN